MRSPAAFAARIDACWERMRPAEQRVACFIQENREEALIASASALAEMTGTSDASVVRTAQALGFEGMEHMRRTLAAELREDLSPASRLARTLSETGDDLAAAFHATLDIHQQTLESLRREVTPRDFQAAVQHVLHAGRVFIFGIGPSSAMADYFAIQLGRFGVDARSLTHSGRLLADGLQKLREGDLLMIFAYSHVYPELAALLDQADRRSVKKILFSDTLGSKLRDRIDLVVPVARGRAHMLSMHTGTLGLIEALLVGIATKRPAETVASLEALNRLRTELMGEPMGLPVSSREA